MRVSLFKGLSFIALLAMGTVPPAMAQIDSREGIALQNQMAQLRQEVLLLRDQMAHSGSLPSRAASGGGSNDMVAQLLTRIDTLEDQVRQLRGQVDELRNYAQRQNADLGKRVDDLAYQMNNTPAANPTATPPVVPPSLPQPPVTPKARTPDMAMQEGSAALARRDYTAAEQAAREVVTAKTSPRAYDGQLLLAQALMGQRQYSDAAIAYDDTYKRNPKGSHAQDSLLGLANALTGLNEKKAACATLDKLRAAFPQPRADLRDGLATAGQRAGCR